MLKALSCFDDGNLRRLSQPIEDRLVKAAIAVDLDRLPEIAVAGRGVDRGAGLGR